MPVKDPIEFGSGSLYFKGVDEPIEVNEVNCISADEDHVDDVNYINLSNEPITFECKAEFNRDWTMVKCCRCRNELPVTEFWALLYGRDNWLCPVCKFREALEDAGKRR